MKDGTCVMINFISETANAWSCFITAQHVVL